MLIFYCSFYIGTHESPTLKIIAIMYIKVYDTQFSFIISDKSQIIQVGDKRKASNGLIVFYVFGNLL